MDMDQGSTNKLWLEKSESYAKKLNPDKNYHLKKYHLDKNLIQSIKLFSKKNSISWELLINTAWSILLNRLSTSDYILFGVSTTNLKSKFLKINHPIFFIKSIVNNKLSIESHIKKIKNQLNNKNKSKNYIIPDELRYLLLIKKTVKKQKLDKIDINRFPLILSVEKDKFTSVSFFYNTYFFSKESIDNLFSHLSVIIQEICKNIKQKIITLNILTVHEKKLLLENWSKIKYNFPTPQINSCVHELFSDQAKKLPEHIAIYHNDITISYKLLDNAANNLAFDLIKKGILPGDYICVLMDRTPTLIMAMLAIFKIGATYIPINPKYPDDRIEYVITDSQAKCILVNNPDKLSKKHQAITITIPLLWSELEFLEKSKSSNLPEITPDQLAYIIYTSGTTGKPKGVMIQHKSLSNLIAWYQGYFKVTSNDRASQFASQGFDTFLCETIPFLASGASVHIVDDNTKLTPSLFFAWLVDQKITICDLPTSYAQMLFTLPWPTNTELRLVKIGGETVTRYPTQAFSFDIWNGYGPTETTVEATFIKLYEANSSPDAISKIMPPPIGKPIVNYEAYIVDHNLQPVPIGISGELLIGGICVSTGYLNRDDLTKEKFITNPFNKNSDYKLYRTGDLVRWLPDGTIEFKGRIDHQVKIRGYRIELGDIESVISQHPDVHEVVVMAKEILNGEKSLVAYIVPNLDRGRYLYQERCLLSINNNKFIETITEDISKHGIALSGITESLNPGQLVQLHLKLPGLTNSKLLSGHVIWKQDSRCGIVFDLNNEEQEILIKSIDYYLATHNVLELVLSASAKRSLRKALRKKLPDYMVPSVFVTLMQFPLTFSGKIDIKALPPPQEFEQILQKEYVEPQSETEKQLTEIWKQLLNEKMISMTDNFFDIGGTSLTAAELSVKIFNQFHISIPTKILFDLSYIPILAEYIDSDGKKYTTQTIIQDEIQRDTRLHENIIPTKKLSVSIKNPQNILLTGAGGFLGIYLLKDLLSSTSAKIYCLIRRNEFESAANRLLSTSKKFNLTNEVSLSERRIVVVSSDISYDNFGLPLEQYNNLVEKIDLIYHCGAQVNIMAAYNKLRGSNVQGTLGLIKFATTHVDKPIHYISTLSAACKKDSSGNLLEDFPNDNYEDLFGGYAISKWVSEKLLTEVANRGLPVSIYRSGYISGQSDTGVTSLNDALLMLIKGCIQLGYAPEMEEKITILPVDFVSKAIVQISLNYSDNSTVYHLDHPTGILWSDLVAWINDYGYKIKIIPMEKWQEKLSTISKENALYPFIPYYLAIKKNELSPGVHVNKTSSVLKNINLSYPDIDDKLLTIYFDYLCQINFLPIPNKTFEKEIL